MYSVFINKPPIPKTLATIPALFAKSSLVWPAILNLILLSRERKRFIDDLVEEGSKLLRSVKNIKSTISLKSHASNSNLAQRKTFADSSINSLNQASSFKGSKKSIDKIVSTQNITKTPLAELGADLKTQFSSPRSSDVFAN